jgi:hypothetical protein
MQSAAAYFDGMEIRFRAANASTTASTVNVNSLGVKNIKQADGVTDITTEISTTADSILRFDNANDCFIYDTGIGTATTTSTGLSILPSVITLQNNVTDPNNDIDFSAGVMQFDDGSGQAVTTAITKQLDAVWSTGTNQGGLDTGVKANDTWYYCYTIYNPTTGATDAIFTASYGSPTMPSGFTKQTYRGAIQTDGTGNIRTGQFVYYQNNYNFIFDVSIKDFDGQSTTTATNRTISIPAKSNVIARISAQTSAGAANVTRVYSPLITEPPVISGYDNSLTNILDDTNRAELEILCNSTSQIATKSNGNHSIAIYTMGFNDKL